MMRMVTRDLGWNRIEAELKAADGLFVKVGFLEGDVHHPKLGPFGKVGEARTLAQVAAWNEYGNARIPERSFMRSTLIDKATEIAESQAKLLDHVYNKTMGFRQGLGILGALVASFIQAKIASGVPPPNHPWTIKLKGSTVPLIDSGQMLQGVRWAVVTGRERSASSAQVVTP